MADDKVRLGQVIGVFGPGSMLDLPERSLPDYHSGATGIPGRSSEGLFLWRSQRVLWVLRVRNTRLYPLLVRSHGDRRVTGFRYGSTQSGHWASGEAGGERAGSENLHRALSGVSA